MIKKSLLVIFIITLLAQGGFSLSRNIWDNVSDRTVPATMQVQHPIRFLEYALDETALKLQLLYAPADPAHGVIVSLPLPDGTFRDFKVWETPLMPEELAAKYPQIKTYTGQSLSNHAITAKLDFTLYGFHAMIFDGERTSFIDPVDRFCDGYYMVHYKKDEVRNSKQRMNCLVGSANGKSHVIEPFETMRSKIKQADKTFNGYQLRTYRIAIGADSYYSIAATGVATPTVAQVLSCITTTLNRVNGVYERELSVTMVLPALETRLIFTAATGDPYYFDDNNAGNVVVDNQVMCDSLIGNANYDIGHVFTTGSGGLSDVAIVCQSGLKASSTTGQPVPVGDGFDIDYVAHEIGHEFGSDHTFNDNMDGSCSGNAVADVAFEPGSGSTIMCYAGICSPDDLQPHSDDYFSAASLIEIQSYISGTGDGCAVHTPSLNFQVHLRPFTDSYSIPFNTPFELIAPVAIDSVPDSAVLYCWEQFNLGDFGMTFTNTHHNGPIFRSVSPSANDTRVFPNNSMVMNGTLSNAGTENAQGEKAPDVARFLTFKLTMRDIINGNGIFSIPDDSVHLNVINTGTPFTIASQSAPGIVYTGASEQTVIWNISGTNVAPINTTAVDIYLSVDNGNTWGYHLGTFSNSGFASVIIPNPPVNTGQARIKVKGNGNVFFNVNTTPFTIQYDSTKPVSAFAENLNTGAGSVTIYPNPVAKVLHVIASTGINECRIYDATGNRIWTGTFITETEIPVLGWVRGVYYLETVNRFGERILRKFTVTK
jgi:Metallo-peptidase family M12B Reprolysin-like